MRSSTYNYLMEPMADHRRGTLPALAAEHRVTYEPIEDDRPGAPGQADAAATDASPGADEAPFGMPVLAELPGLTAALTRLADADDAMLDAVAALADLLDTDEVSHATGVGIEHWVGIVARHTRMDRRFLLRTARHLTRYPSLRSAVDTRAVSWPQLRGLSIALREVPTPLTDRVDGYLGQLVHHLDPDADPDAIVEQLRRTLDAWKAELEPTTVDVPSGNRLALQPNLEGTGGTGYLDLDAVGLAIVDEATHPRNDQLQHPGGLAAARADNLLAYLTGSGLAADDDDRNAHDASAHGGRPDGDGAADRDGRWLQGLKPPKLLLRAELSTLLDGERLPTELLTRLVGGSVRLTADAARRLCDARGVELRTIVVDRGRVVGVGRQTRRPPGWLTDAITTLHTTCTGPLCDRPARGAQLDHAVPWWPIGPDQAPGTTDTDNLGPLCGRTNREKEASGWRATQRGDGRRRWHHPRTGLTTTSIPATWRPPDPIPEDRPPDPPPPLPPEDRPSGSDPPAVVDL